MGERCGDVKDRRDSIAWRRPFSSERRVLEMGVEDWCSLACRLDAC